MQSIYLDTNVYIIGLTQPESNSALILEAVAKGEIHIIITNYLVDETVQWFRQRKGKEWVGRARLYMATIPKATWVNNVDWEFFLDQIKEKVQDVDDWPHIAAYFAEDCGYFVTTNRRLTQMAICDVVSFITPQEFVVDCLQSTPIDGDG